MPVFPDGVPAILLLKDKPMMYFFLSIFLVITKISAEGMPLIVLPFPSTKSVFAFSSMLLNAGYVSLSFNPSAMPILPSATFFKMFFESS